MTQRNLVGLVHNSQVPQTASLVRSLVENLDLGKRCWISPAAEIGDVQDRLQETLLVVVAGGDGTILRTVRTIAPYSVPVVGINMGRVGFMTELTVEEAQEKLPSYMNGDMRVEERMMLRASITSDSQQAPHLVLDALNDVVVGRGDLARLIDINTSIDGVGLTSYRADAVIVSTATGSTGYALSAGGPILYPEAMVMLVQPVAPHTGLRQGLILPEDSVIELSASDGHKGALSVDGFSDAMLGLYDKVTIERSPYVARFLRANPPSTFYTALARRLGLEYRSSPPMANA